jgi:hypothetical protein
LPTTDGLRIDLDRVYIALTGAKKVLGDDQTSIYIWTTFTKAKRFIEQSGFAGICTIFRVPIEDPLRHCRNGRDQMVVLNPVYTLAEKEQGGGRGRY